jgi:DNA-directed RNA polymerase subunit alpha
MAHSHDAGSDLPRSVAPAIDTAAGTNGGAREAFAAGRITSGWIERFRRDVFASVGHRDTLLDSLARPAGDPLERGLLLWALGRFAESTPLLEAELAHHPALGLCLSHAYVAARRFDDAERVVAALDGPARAEALLSIAEARGDADALARSLERHGAELREADRKYFSGRVHELRHEPERAIALYDEALALDAKHRAALFRLALNVDLRGEDEEALELYERALLCPPVNSACVLNLGVLYEDRGNYRRAMQCFDLVLQADPGNERARMYRRDAAASLTMYYDEDQARHDAQTSRLLRTSIGDFELSARTRTGLAKMDVRTLGDLVRRTPADLLRQHDFGESSLAEVKEVLRLKGLRLGMSIDHGLSAEPANGTPDPGANEPLPDRFDSDVTRRPVTSLDLSVRSQRVVSFLAIRTIGDLCAKTEADLLSCPNFGQTSLNEIKCKLDELGMALRR